MTASSAPAGLALSLALFLLSACPPGPGGMDGPPGGEADGPAGADAASDDMAGSPAHDMGAARFPIERLDQLRLVLVIGDSIAAGYNARGRNGASGKGYARLMVENHASFPAYIGHDLATRFPGVMLRDLSSSGDTSSDQVARLRGALGGLPMTPAGGDVLVLINVGGNDFNDRIDVMIDTVKTREAAARLRANLAAMLMLLRARYEEPGAGRALVALINNIHDPTDGRGEIPPEFSDGFCRIIRNPLFIPFRMQVLANLGLMNSELRTEVSAQRGHLVDIHAGFIGHGMNAGALRWIDSDCAHPTDDGHDLIRRLAWRVLTGESH